MVEVRGSGADIRPVAYVGCPEHQPTGEDLRGFLLRTLPRAGAEHARSCCPRCR
ncbi:hypothetical protein [Streptomyces sp. KL116D]|uniref:hypothetical protein n=1 Tax=Streptomyces sp. KL116D TaxID=3045152 RepID=UPI003555E626